MDRKKQEIKRLSSFWPRYRWLPGGMFFIHLYRAYDLGVLREKPRGYDEWRKEQEKKP